MSNRDFYQETFSQVHSSADLRWEDIERRVRKPRPRRSPRRLLVLAAVLVLLAVLSAAAVSVNLLGVRNLLLPQRQSDPMPDESGSVSSSQAQQEALLSLSGYMNTPESQGLAEWNDFLASYDPDGAILNSMGNYLDASLSPYLCYTVYTQDMADKLEEIAAKYGLTLHTWNRVVEDQAEWISLLGDFLGKNTAYSGRIYEDGTFHYDGYLTTGQGRELDYQFRRSVKGALNDVYLKVDDLSAYQEWHYQTTGGQEVTLDLGPERGFLLADLEDSFVFVNILTGTDQGVTVQDLEDLADSFNFSLLTPAQPLDESLRETDPRETVPQETVSQGIASQEFGQSGLTLPAAFETALLENGTFYDTDSGATTTLLQFLNANAPDGYALMADTFTVVDLDQDSSPEAVLRLTLNVGTDYGWEVLRQGGDGTVYGYALGSRELMDLKADGTFSYSYGAGSNGFGRMLFSDADASGTVRHDWATAPIGYMDTATGADGTVSTSWYLDYQSVTQAEYEAALAAQQGKEDVSWQPLSDIQA